MDGQAELDSLITLLDETQASEFLLYVEPGLVPLLSALAPYSLLQKHGVQSIVPLTEQNAESSQSSARACVYITSGSNGSLKLVSINAKLHVGCSLRVIFIPEIPVTAERLLAQFGVLGDLDLASWPVAFVSDVACPGLLSLFNAESVTNPASGVWPLVWALDALQAKHTGAFGKVTAVGPRARHIALLLEQRREEAAVLAQRRATEPGNFADYAYGYASSTYFGTEIEHAILIDRDLDMVSPLLCQATYLGVLAETAGLSASGTTQSSVKTSLKNDPVFAPIANLEFAQACESLHASAKELQSEYRAGNAAAEQTPTIGEIRSVVAKLGSLQATQRLVDVHTELASRAVAALERGISKEVYDLQTQILDSYASITQPIARIQDLVYRGAPLALVLRLLALLCLTRGGIKENVLQALLHGDILKTYGYEHLTTIHHLYDRGLIFSPRSSSFLFGSAPLASLAGFGALASNKSGSSESSQPAATDAVTAPDGATALGAPLTQTYPWSTLNKACKLCPSEASEAKPLAGVVPFTARIAQMALNLAPRAKTPIEAEFFEQSFVSKDKQSAREAKLRRTLLRNSPSGSLPIVLVVVTGGVTYAEVEAIKRALAKDEAKPRKVVIAATCVVTGDKFVL